LEQFRQLKVLGVDKAVLVDDVIFSGNLMSRVVASLGRVGIQIPVVCAGIAIQEGIDLLAKKGIEVRAVRRYVNVIDEVCERDFYPGVPLCGRLVKEAENTGAAYILPFGNPGKWASIPRKWQNPFSRFCIQQSIKLFEAIEEASGKRI